MRPSSRATPVFGAALALAALAAVPPAGDAQTALVLVAGPASAAAAGGSPSWSAGPTVVVAGGDDVARRLDAAMADLVAAGVADAVVVALEGARLPEGWPGAAPPLPVRVADPADLPAGGEVGAAGSPLFHLRGLTVTATRIPSDVLDAPAPLSVVDPDGPGSRPGAGVADALATLPGVDVSGVGPVQRHPVIRGFGGQRILLLEDGLPLSSPRRRLASVEPTALLGDAAAERVEVVRGPASVLYGSDAIGGVVNVVPAPLPSGGPRGSAEAWYGSAGDERGLTAEAGGAAGAWSLRAAAGGRTAGDYGAPAGTFGDVTLPEGARVRDSGARDLHARVEAARRVGDGGRVFARVQGSRVREAGFGWTDPVLLGEDARVRIHMPDQRFRRLVVGYRGPAPGPVDHLEVTAYGQDDERDFVTEVTSPVGDAPVRTDVRSRSVTDLERLGARVEARSLAAAGLLLTVGLDASRDRSLTADTSAVTVTTPAGQREMVRPSLAVPDARLVSVGAFAQARWAAATATRVTAGLRWQGSRARPVDDPLEGEAVGESALAGSLGVVHHPAAGMALVASLGRGFRSPNLVERFYSGSTPGGLGTWVRNPDLEPETSVSVDLGVRVRRESVSVEAFVFRAELRDGIRLEPTGREADGVPEYRNVNVERQRMTGLEVGAAWSPLPAVTLSGTGSLLDADNPDDADDPVTEAPGRRGALSLRLAPPELPLWAAWTVEHQGRRAAVLDPEGPVGPHLPAATVHAVRAGWSSGRHAVDLAVTNLTDRLWARSANAGFFRPEPGRSLRVRWRVAF